MVGSKTIFCFVFIDIFLTVSGFLTTGIHSIPCSDVIQSRSSVHTSTDYQIYYNEIERPVLVNRVRININCSSDTGLAGSLFTITYIDASDVTREERVYSDSLPGKLGNTLNAHFISVDLEDRLYTQNISLIPPTKMVCSSVDLLGCEATDMCTNIICKNGGSCVGNGRCACQSGHYGDKCEIPINDMPLDDFSFEKMVGNSIIQTPAADFAISGSVTLELGSGQTNKQRRFFQGGRCLFNGFQSSLTCSSHHHNNHYGGSGHHHSSNSLSSVFGNFAHGFSHSCSMSFGHSHDHHQTSHLYTTHGNNHHQHGASLSYCQNSLTMHVQNGNYHHQLSVPFIPVPSIDHVITSSFSPSLGCSLFIDGHHQGSQVKPTVTVPGSTSQFNPLCIGSCGFPVPQYGTGRCSFNMSNIVAAGLNVAGMAANGLLHILGNVFHGTPKLPTTTLEPVSATSHSIHAITTVHVNQCYDCTKQLVDGTCTSMSPCPSGMMCAVFHDNVGYTYRCMEQFVCELGQNVTSTDCWHCCTGDRCNNRCPVPCFDSPQCATIKSMTSYNVCGDAVLAQTHCKKTCGQCSSSG